jgi:hypothetical protein
MFSKIPAGDADLAQDPFWQAERRGDMLISSGLLIDSINRPGRPLHESTRDLLWEVHVVRQDFTRMIRTPVGGRRLEEWFRIDRPAPYHIGGRAFPNAHLAAEEWGWVVFRCGFWETPPGPNGVLSAFTVPADGRDRQFYDAVREGGDSLRNELAIERAKAAFRFSPPPGSAGQQQTGLRDGPFDETHYVYQGAKKRLGLRGVPMMDALWDAGKECPRGRVAEGRVMSAVYPNEDGTVHKLDQVEHRLNEKFQEPPVWQLNVRRATEEGFTFYEIEILSHPERQ